MRSWIVGICGASGAVYGVRLAQWLLDAGYDVHGVITDAGWRVLKEEHGWDSAHRNETVRTFFSNRRGTYTYYTSADIGARIASGSFRTAGMVIMPCSMGTLSALAHSMSDELIERAADVVRKERRPLIVVPRETPLHAGHLQNMLTLAQQGVHIVPAMPAFYHRPQTIDDMVDFLVGKVLDVMGIDHDVFPRWGG